MAAFAGLLNGDPDAVAGYFTKAYSSHWTTVNVTGAVLFVEGPSDRVHQVVDPSGRVWHVVADARLDDRENLTSALQRSEATGDEELLALAFGQWGQGFSARVMGTFVLMAWCPADGTLLLVRDPVGGRPVFYHKAPGCFACATDLPAVLALPTVSRQLRLEMLAGLLGRAPGLTGTGSYYRDLELLPVGHVLRVDKGTVSVQRWWQPPPVSVREHPAAELRNLITMAVEERLRGGRQCAVFLSGGLDSSAIACIAARRLKREGRRLLALSAILPEGWSGPETDERSHIEAVLAQEDNIDIVWSRPGTHTGAFDALPEYFDLLHYPPYSNVTHAEMALAAAGKTHGVDLVLSGFGGDFFVSSQAHRYPLALGCEGEWRLALRELKAKRRKGVPWSVMMRSELIGPLVHVLLPLSRSSSMPGRLLIPLLRGHRRPFSQDIPVVAPLRRQMAFLLGPGRIELCLNSTTQVFRQIFGQTLLFPLLDRRLLEFMLSLEAGQIRRDDVPRYLFRQAMEGILPEVIRQRLDKGPAFDPLIAARLIAARGELTRWAETTANHPSWDIVNRDRFLEGLEMLRQTNRAGWQREMFQCVLEGGMIARFIQWHDQQMESP